MTAHKHAALMAELAEVAKTSETPWDQFEYLDIRESDQWLPVVDPIQLWRAHAAYRRKPAKPKEPWKPERPTWCEVWNNDTPNDKEVRLIVYYFNCAIGDEYTVPEPRMKYHDGDKGFWDHATPTTPPAWWPKEWV